MGVLFAVLTLMATIWSAVAYFRVYNAMREHLPPQFQDEESSRYAFSVWALQPSTPLSVQAEYVRYVKATCVAVLCGALALLAFHQIIFGCLFLAAFFYSVFSAARSSRIYKQNCEKASTEGSERDK